MSLYQHFAINTLILRFVAAKFLRHNLSLRNYIKHDLQSILCHTHSDKIDDQRFAPMIIQTLDINWFMYNFIIIIYCHYTMHINSFICILCTSDFSPTCTNFEYYLNHFDSLSSLYKSQIFFQQENACKSILENVFTIRLLYNSNHSQQ